MGGRRGPRGPRPRGRREAGERPKDRPKGEPPGGAGKWEYRVLDVPLDEALGPKLEKRLADLGGEGWELAGVIVPPAPAAAVRFVLKRPK